MSGPLVVRTAGCQDLRLPGPLFARATRNVFFLDGLISWVLVVREHFAMSARNVFCWTVGYLECCLSGQLNSESRTEERVNNGRGQKWKRKY